MARTLSVDVNRRSVHSIEPQVRQLETDDSFVIELTNHGAATHVHLNVDDTLAETLSVAGGNYFIEAGRTRRIEATVDQRSRPVSGRLRIATGYGAETAVIDVSLTPSEDRAERQPVEVDDSLSKPRPRQQPEQTETDLPVRAIAAGTVVVLALLLVVVGALVAGNPAVILGVGIVLLGIAGAAVLLYGS